MASASDFGYEDPKLDEKLDHDDDDEQEVNRTRRVIQGIIILTMMVKQ